MQTKAKIIAVVCMLFVVHAAATPVGATFPFNEPSQSDEPVQTITPQTPTPTPTPLQTNPFESDQSNSEQPTVQPTATSEPGQPEADQLQDTTTPTTTVVDQNSDTSTSTDPTSDTSTDDSGSPADDVIALRQQAANQNQTTDAGSLATETASQPDNSGLILVGLGAIFVVGSLIGIMVILRRQPTA